MSPTLRHGLALALVLGTFGTLVSSQDAVGIPRDESVYFEAGERYAAWFGDLASDPLEALSEPGIRRRFEYNREHPALPKILFGLSHALFTDTLGWTGHRLGFRLPAIAASALLVLGVFLLGLRLTSWPAALFAALATALVPRHFFHLHLAAFDVPVTAAWVWGVLLWHRALAPDARLRHHLAVGLVFGLALAVKHNAYFLAPLLGLHWLVTRWGALRAAPGWRARLRAVPGALWAMAALGPLVLFATWPFLWHHPLERFGWYLAFHARHVHYSWHYLGEVLRAPPFPWGYPFVVTGLTVPLPVLVPMGLGAAALAWRLVRDLRRRGPGPPGAPGTGRAAAPGRRVAPVLLADGAGAARSDRVLVALNALFPIALIALPAVPIFGGVKHWLPAMPFLALLAGEVVVAAAGGVRGAGRRTATALALGALLLVPTGLLARHFHPYGTSAYNELAGGLPGAASLGMQRQYWSNAVTGVLPELNALARRGARVYLHEVTWASFRWYQREGLLRPDLRFADAPDAADLTAYQYHQEFRDREFEVWSVYGTRRPVAGVGVDAVPLVTLYARPHTRRR